MTDDSDVMRYHLVAVSDDHVGFHSSYRTEVEAVQARDRAQYKAEVLGLRTHYEVRELLRA